MYLKQLKIETSEKIIRTIDFHIGTNLIVDETNKLNTTETGNNIGKTTVLALIDYCLGGDPNQIYKDSETKKEIGFVKNYLVENKVLITLTLKKDLLNESSEEIIIKRNFLQRKQKIMSINNENLPQNQGKDFVEKLNNLLLGEREEEKPSFRQLISHNIRYKDQRINNTLKVLNNYASNTEYETLYLYMFGLPVSDRTNYNKKLKVEKKFKSKLEKHQSKTSLELQVDIIKSNISMLEKKKNNLNINEKYEEELQELNNLKYKISKLSTKVSELTLRKELLKETELELQKDISNVDFKDLRKLYAIAKKNIQNIQVTFEEMVQYHNNMVLEKIKYITQDLPELEIQIAEYNKELTEKLSTEKELSKKLSSSDTFDDLEHLISELNENYRKLGEFEGNISKIEETEQNIKKFEKEINLLGESRFTEQFQKALKRQLKRFNSFFTNVSKELYGEEYGISYEIKEDQSSKQQYYSFESFNLNTSSGKKQGEILCFDLAYILFARSENIPSLDFILNDKKELMHDNQLLIVTEFAWDKNIQLVFSILNDKIPEKLNDDKHVILRLSENDKLFRIEEH
ncbi:DUF2326 domain-containing protein [Mammaliicoccus sciuri]|uniref:DUF2326 domain-containing protein n=1 Tax=Mammaliicoccus sciuri TaxID=1296 RepID=UPI001E5D20AC|nr:DUF2326 domain-containing protein [Mammaliicoccus sciuri]MEB6057296.1 DUF2326 domain-containing protein [Mammaliicoccus sciuri]